MKCKLTPQGKYSEVHRSLSNIPEPNARDLADKAYSYIYSSNHKYSKLADELLWLSDRDLNNNSRYTNSPLLKQSLFSRYGYTDTLLTDDTNEPKIFFITQIEQVVDISSDPTSVVYPTQIATVSDKYSPDSIPVFVTKTPLQDKILLSNTTPIDTNMFNERVFKMLNKDNYTTSTTIPVDSPRFYAGQLYTNPATPYTEIKVLLTISDNLKDLEPLFNNLPAIQRNKFMSSARALSTNNVDTILNAIYSAYKANNPALVQTIDDIINVRLKSTGERIDTDTALSAILNKISYADRVIIDEESRIQMEKDFSEYSSKVIFEGAPTDRVNPFTGRYISQHDYRDADTKELIPTSVTALKSEYPIMSFDKIEHFTNLIYHSKRAEYALLRKILKPIDSDDPVTDAKIYQRRIEDFVVKLLEKKGGDVFKIHKDLLNSDLEKYYNTFETMSDGTVAGSYTVLHLANSLDENNNPIWTDPYMGMSPYEYSYYVKTLAWQDERYGNEYDVEYMEDYDETGNLVYYDSSSVGQEHMRMQQLIESEDKLTKREVLTQDKLRKHVLALFDLANKDLEDEIARWERTAEFGTKVHRTIQALLKDENDPDFNDEDRHILSGFTKLQEQAQISIQALDELLTDLNLDPDDFAHMNFNETRKKLVGGDDGGMIHQYLRFNTIKDYVDRTFKGQFEVIEALYTLAGFKINSSGHIVKLSKQEIKDNTKPAQQFLKEKKVEVLDKDNNTKIPTWWYSFMKFALKENQAYMDALLSKFRLVDPIPVQKIKLRDSILAFKKYIQDKGGIIKTEMIVHTDKILSSDLSQHIRVAGQADIVVLYPNTKTFDVYDIKTMNQYIPRSHELYTRKDYKEYTKFTGYSPKKMMEHAFQLQNYVRMIELETGYKHLPESNKIGIIPIHVNGIDNNLNLTGAIELMETVGESPYFVDLRQEMYKDVPAKTSGENVVYRSFAGVQAMVDARYTGMIKDEEIVTEESALREEFEQVYTEALDKRVLEVIDKIRMYIADQINRLRNEDKILENKEKLARLYQLQNDMGTLSDMQSIVRFVLLAEPEIDMLAKQLHQTNKSLRENLANSTDTRSEQNIYHDALQHVDTIRIHLEAYNLLDEIRDRLGDKLGRVLDYKIGDTGLATSTSIQTSTQISSSFDFAKIIAKRSRVLEDTYMMIHDILAERMSSYINTTTNWMAGDYYNYILDRVNADIDTINKKLDSGDTSTSTRLLGLRRDEKSSLERKLKSKLADRERLIKDRDKLIWDVSRLKQEFVRVTEDISFLQRWLIGAPSSSDPLLALYSKMIKFETSNAELQLKNDIIDLQNKIEKHLAKNPVWADTEGYYKPILETRLEWIDDEDAQGNPTRSLQETLSLIDEYGTRLHTLTNGEQHELSYKQIIQDYMYRIASLYREGKYVDAEKVKDEFRVWKRENMLSEYGEDYNNWQALLHKDTVGEKLSAKLQELNLRAASVREQLDELNMSSEESTELLKIRSERKALKSLYEPDGITKKTGMDLLIAERYNEYLSKYSEFYDTTSNTLRYEMLRRELLQKFEEDPKSYYKFMELSHDYTLTKDFYQHHKRMINERNVDYAYIWSNRQDTGLLNLIERTRLMSDEDYNKAIEEYEASVGYKLSKNNPHQEKFDQVYDLLARYRMGDEVNNEILPDDVREVIKDLDTYLINLTGGWDWDNLAKHEQEAISSLISHNQLIKQFADYTPTSTYYREYYAHLEAEEFDVNKLAQTKWFQDNHYKIPDDKANSDKVSGLITIERWTVVKGEKVLVLNHYAPIRSWRKLTYVGGAKRTNNYYNIDRQDQLDKLKVQYPNKNKAQLEAAIRQTAWYKHYHDEKGNLKHDSYAYLDIDEDKKYVTKELSDDFNTSKIKDIHLSDNYDENNMLLPQRDKWVNNKFTNLQATNPDMFEFMQHIKEFYKLVQSKLPVNMRKYIGYRLPFVDKGERQQGLLNNIKQIALGERGSVKSKLGELMRRWGQDTIFANPNEDLLVGDKKLYNKRTDDKYLSVPFMNYIPIANVTHDVLGSIITFAASAYRRDALSNILAESRSLAAVITRAEKQYGAPKTDALGNPYLDAAAIRAGIGTRPGTSIESDDDNLVPDTNNQDTLATSSTSNTYLYTGKMSNRAQMFFDYMGAEMYNELNKPVEFATPINIFGKRIFRGDKIADTVMGFASLTQIGGITSSAWAKGLANWAQGNVQVFIETAASEYLSADSLKRASNLLKYRFKGIWNAVKTDSGKLTPTSLLGQLFDLYEALPGEFADSVGKKVAGNWLYRNFTSDIWFYNQYFGEFDIAMRTMLAHLNAYKVIDGQVYDWQMYYKREVEALGRKLNSKEQDELRMKFDAIDKSLLDSFEVGADNKLKIKDGVNYQLGSKLDNEVKARLRALSTKLQGAYARHNRAAAQKTFFGRLLFMYKKYLPQALRRRYGKLRRDEELGDFTEGYYRTFARLLFTQPKTVLQEFIGSLIPRRLRNKLGFLTNDKLHFKERANLRRAAREMTVLFIVSAIAMSLGADDGDDDEMASYYLLYVTERLRKEISSLVMVNPEFLQDNYKIMKNVSAITSFTDKLKNFLMQLWEDSWSVMLGGEAAVFERATKSAEKGDSKLWDRLDKLLDAVGAGRPIEEMYENLTRKG